VSEPQATEYHKKYTCTQELWVTYKACCTQQHTLQVIETTWTDDSTLAIFSTCTTSSLHCAVVRRDNLESSNFNTGTMSQSTKTNGIDRLPCGYLHRSSHWIGKSMRGKSMRGLSLASKEVNCPWSDGLRIQLSSRVGFKLKLCHAFIKTFNECMTQYTQNKSQKWLTALCMNCVCTCKWNRWFKFLVRGRSKQTNKHTHTWGTMKSHWSKQTSKHTHTHGAQWSHTGVGRALASPNYLFQPYPIEAA